MQKFIIDSKEIEMSKIHIKGQDARHIKKVLRLKLDDDLSMTDGRGKDFCGKIIGLTQESVEVVVTEEKKSITESDLDLTLCTAMLKHKKMDEVVKQISQLGVTQWLPFFSKRSIPMSNPKKQARQMERWQSIARESLKQCRRSCLVKLHPPMGFESMLDFANPYPVKIAFWEEAARPLRELPAVEKTRAIVLVGPEGGFDPGEISQAREAGFLSYTLGPRILRAETAAVLGAGLVQYLLGDMGGR
ncbi:MAG: 16S rRNA (uracil(1498)-N(3))-methyltransferase [Desulfobacter sp.]|nr:16S rRNA (uracil(1498)-N(3))-methyltransferase [Desulfobacter sp.]